MPPPRVTRRVTAQLSYQSLQDDELDPLTDPEEPAAPPTKSVSSKGVSSKGVSSKNVSSKSASSKSASSKRKPPVSASPNPRHWNHRDIYFAEPSLPFLTDTTVTFLDPNYLYPSSLPLSLQTWCSNPTVVIKMSSFSKQTHCWRT